MTIRAGTLILKRVGATWNLPAASTQIQPVQTLAPRLWSSFSLTSSALVGQNLASQHEPNVDRKANITVSIPLFHHSTVIPLSWYKTCPSVQLLFNYQYVTFPCGVRLRGNKGTSRNLWCRKSNVCLESFDCQQTWRLGGNEVWHTGPHTPCCGSCCFDDLASLWVSRWNAPSLSQTLTVNILLLSTPYN